MKSGQEQLNCFKVANGVCNFSLMPSILRSMFPLDRFCVTIVFDKKISEEGEFLYVNIVVKILKLNI